MEFRSIDRCSSLSMIISFLTGQHNELQWSRGYPRSGYLRKRKGSPWVASGKGELSFLRCQWHHVSIWTWSDTHNRYHPRPLVWTGILSVDNIIRYSIFIFLPTCWGHYDAKNCFFYIYKYGLVSAGREIWLYRVMEGLKKESHQNLTSKMICTYHVQLIHSKSEDSGI